MRWIYRIVYIIIRIGQRLTEIGSRRSPGCGRAVAAGIGLGGAATGAILLGLGTVIDRLDLLTGQTRQRVVEPEPPPVVAVTCPSCGERQNAPADRPHYDCAKCGEPVIRDWVQLGREA